MMSLSLPFPQSLPALVFLRLDVAVETDSQSPFLFLFSLLSSQLCYQSSLCSCGCGTVCVEAVWEVLLSPGLSHFWSKLLFWPLE